MIGRNLCLWKLWCDAVEKALDKDSCSLRSIPSPTNSLKMFLGKLFQRFVPHFHLQGEGQTHGPLQSHLIWLNPKIKTWFLLFLVQTQELYVAEGSVVGFLQQPATVASTYYFFLKY